jgi:hypothetical protein
MHFAYTANLYVSYDFYNKESKYIYETLTGDSTKCSRFCFLCSKACIFRGYVVEHHPADV